ncbi:MAG: arsenate reductase ArsC [Pirellulaceae bacterium]|nr:arsenate reductase ArsC [Pirellulaceae bacterium]
MPQRVLILCTGNSCRSQMAQWLWNSFGKGDWQADSAGSKPSGYVHPLAIEVMKELGEDLSQARSKHLDEFLNEPIDLVVTVCDNAEQACPTFPNAQQTLHWPFEDPADAEGTDEEKKVVFRRIRDEIKETIQSYLANGQA